MQLRYLEYFAALARERHFARAAEACHVAQPTLSAGIIALEDMLGTRLVLRDRRFLDLTAEGHAILPFAQQMIADHAAMRAAINSDAGPLRGTLRLGAIPAAMPSVGQFVTTITELQPALHIEVRSLTSREIESSLIARDLDAGITYLSSEPLAQVRSVPLHAENFLFATQRGGAFDRREAVAMADAAASRLCLLHQGMQNRRILDAVLAERGLAVEPVATADSYVALLAMVMDGGLSAIVTDSHRRLIDAQPDILLLPFSDPPPPNQIGLVILNRDPISPLARVAETAARQLLIDDSYHGIADPI